MARDDFTEKVKQKLRNLAGSVCSNPDCEAATVALATDEDSLFSVGVAAHIHAAAPGGTRYLASMTSQERSSAKNGIWLCQKCAKLVDADEDFYSADKLRHWRNTAAEKARTRVRNGQPLHVDPTRLLTQALTGMPATATPAAISNVHRAVASGYEKLDPRFKVSTAHHGDTTEITLHPQERVPIKLAIPKSLAPQWTHGISQVIEHGRSVSLRTEGMTVDGSPLVANLFASENTVGGTLTISPHGMPAEIEVFLVGGEHQERQFVCVAQGKVVWGTKSATFTSSCWGGLLEIQLTFLVDPFVGSGNFVFGANFAPWHSIELESLPHLDRLLAFYASIAAGKGIEFEVYANGAHLMKSKAPSFGRSKSIAETLIILQYVTRARTVARTFGSKVLFTENYRFTAIEHAQIAEVADIIEKPSLDAVNSVTANVTMPVSTVLALEQGKVASGESEITMSHVRTAPLRVFGVDITVPPLLVEFRGTTIGRVRRLKSKASSPDVPLKVTWKPGKDFQGRRYFDVTGERVAALERESQPVSD